MEFLHTESLAETVDAVNEAFFFGRRIPKKEAGKVADWIVGRLGEKGSYGGMFAPTEADYENPVRVFTGEKVTSGAATGHIIGEEACRALILLNVDSAKAQKALKSATEGMLERIVENEKQNWKRGMY
ncbi:MAG: hypothetical protein GF315_06860 [candidate division Zixibacteria bacterium]|nr:hypothetical protein [candidate division Zixibacteria bacterium]